MSVRLLVLSAALAVGATAAFAETFEIQMLNRGEDGAMVFEPGFVQAAVGDTIHFLPVDKGHNVESIEGMIPDGADPIKTAMDEEFSWVVSVEGVYGLKCTPHYGMGMVALIQVGAPVNLETAVAVQHRGKAAQRFEAEFARVAQ
jgi:pseudoazurin